MKGYFDSFLGKIVALFNFFRVFVMVNLNLTLY